MRKTAAFKDKILFLPLAVAAMALLFSYPVKSQPQMLFSGLPGQEKYHNPDLVYSFYQNRNMEPLWIRGSGSFQPRAEAALKILQESWTHGLNPAQYNVMEIAERVQHLSSGAVLALDTLISDSLVRYVSDLTSMRGASATQIENSRYWRTPIDKAGILYELAGAADPIQKIRAVEPNNALYESLRQELIRLSKEPQSDFKPLTINALLKPGDHYKQVPIIRARFGLDDVASSETYDDALASHVMSLQRAYGLNDDGIIGPKTLALINMTNQDKMRQIIANMERLRWVGDSRPERYVLVNIPSATLWAVDRGLVVLEMPVIVGKAARPTNSFRTEISGVRFNPNWTVPPTIKKADFLPMLREDPYVLTKRGIELVSEGYTIDPGSVDWNAISPRDLHKIRMIQAPGDDNPLGKVRVIMENPYNIYLHDTNHREAFGETERTLSSGCIRVSKPEELADFILSKNKGWSQERLRTLVDSKRMRDIQTEQKLPVFIMYQTVWLDTEGRLIYGRDIYGEDAKLVKILEKMDAIHIHSSSENLKISL
jgi:L,D-transpeptidase YcbB